MAAGSFSGLWDDDEGLVVRIEGAEEHGAPHVASMHMPDGGLVELRITSRRNCCFEAGGELYEGTLADDGSLISWSDGGSWLRQVVPPEPPPAPAAGAAEAKAPPPGRGIGAEGLLGASWAAGRGLLVSASLGRGGRGFRKGLGKGKGKAHLYGGDVPHVAKTFSLDRAVSLQEELLDAFADEGFQGRLREVERLYGKAYEECTEAHKDLYLEVHREVLPRYNFQGSAEGVREMLAAAARHNADQDFWRNRLRLNRLLGLEPPPAKLVGEDTLPDDALRAEPAADAGAAAVSGARAQRPVGRVRVTARHATENEELQVMVPEAATFGTVKEAISKKIGRGSFLKRGRLVGLEDEIFIPHKDENHIGDLREVLVLGFSLQTHDDEEAKAWRHELAQRNRAAGQK